MLFCITFCIFSIFLLIFDQQHVKKITENKEAVFYGVWGIMPFIFFRGYYYLSLKKIHALYNPFVYSSVPPIYHSRTIQIFLNVFLLLASISYIFICCNFFSVDWATTKIMILYFLSFLCFAVCIPCLIQLIEYDNIIKKWLDVFYKRFYQNQFKRSCLPDGPKVGTVSLSPRGDWRMPSDSEIIF